MAFQGLFRRINTHVVVKTIHLTAKDRLEVGTVIDPEKMNIKVFQLRLWFQRRKIGVVGSSWAEGILNGHIRPEGLVIDKTRDIKVLVDTLVAVGGIKAVGLETIEGAQELIGAQQNVVVDKAPDAKPAEVKVDEPTATEPELTKAEKDRIKKDKKNARERQRRADKAAAKAAK